MNCASGRWPRSKPFLQGGYFRNFLRKYDESNQLHKRMLWVSERVAAARRMRPVRGREACDFLYRAQSNDVYWHGVFGGLYLNHLREAAYANLLRAEAASDAVLHGEKDRWTEAERGDIDRDGGEELLLKTSGLTLLAHAHDGGAVTEISLSPAGGGARARADAAGGRVPREVPPGGRVVRRVHEHPRRDRVERPLGPVRPRGRSVAESFLPGGVLRRRRSPRGDPIGGGRSPRVSPRVGRRPSRSSGGGAALPRSSRSPSEGKGSISTS